MNFDFGHPAPHGRDWNLRSLLKGMHSNQIATGEVKLSDDVDVFGAFKNSIKKSRNRPPLKGKRQRRNPEDVNYNKIKLSQPLAVPEWLQGIQNYSDDDDEEYDNNDQPEQSDEDDQDLRSDKKPKITTDFFGLGGGDDEQESPTIETHHVDDHQVYKLQKTHEIEKKEEEANKKLSLNVSEAEVPDYETASNNFFESIASKQKQTKQASQNQRISGGGGSGRVLNLPETEAYEWNRANLKYKARTSSLSAQKCWKCKRVGHLPEDCTVTIGVPAASPADPFSYKAKEVNSDKRTNGIYSAKLRKMHKRCKELQSKRPKCAACGVQSNLVHCLDCEGVFCDGKGHLIDHLRQNSSHRMLYSYKLRRQIKCCNATCEEMDASRLLACAHCLHGAFESGYSMISATWSGNALKKFPNAICCEEHFQWHSINCLNAHSSEHVVEDDKVDTDEYNGILSEFLF